MKKVIQIIAVVLMLICLTGCKTERTDALIGTWKEIYPENMMHSHCVFTFQNDGQGLLTGADEVDLSLIQQAFTYTYTDGRLFIHFPLCNEQYIVKFNSHTEMTWSRLEGNNADWPSRKFKRQ